jgi:hypothetical protein
MARPTLHTTNQVCKLSMRGAVEPGMTNGRVLVLLRVKLETVDKLGKACLVAYH